MKKYLSVFAAILICTLILASITSVADEKIFGEKSDKGYAIAIINKTGSEINYLTVNVVEHNEETPDTAADNTEAVQEEKAEELFTENNYLKDNEVFVQYETRILYFDPEKYAEEKAKEESAVKENETKAAETTETVEAETVAETAAADTEEKAISTEYQIVFKVVGNDTPIILSAFPMEDTVDVGIYYQNGIYFIHYISLSTNTEFNTFEAEKALNPDSYIEPTYNYSYDDYSYNDYDYSNDYYYEDYYEDPQGADGCIEDGLFY